MLAEATRCMLIAAFVSMLAVPPGCMVVGATMLAVATRCMLAAATRCMLAAATGCR
jgi:hypothetical protein